MSASGSASAHRRTDGLSTAVLIVNSRGQYLLHLRDAHKPIHDPGTWSLVGGAAESGEAPDQAVVREIREETGLVLDEVVPFTSARAGGPYVAAGHILVYTAHWDGEAHTLPVTEGIAFLWADVDTMAHMTMCPWAYEAVRTHHAESPAAPLPGPRAAGGRGGRRASGAVPNVVGAHLLLERDGTTLLGLRHPDVAFAGGEWHALAGHVERESARACLVREAYEEAGLVLEPADLTLVHTVHMLHRPGAEPRIQLFFAASRWSGEPAVREPDRCTRWDWWPLDALPDPMVGYTRAAIEGVRAGSAYTETGWDAPVAREGRPV
ncbi:NUDIX domain-containing protein [Streptomyces sp. NPDC048018]|uniref:NUDIX hydrolase n=1 Tax=Streptomyces sp. NPDC048018 TaxID=3365499 RepID=UPI00372173AD